MKTIDELRKGFEETVDMKDYIKLCYFCEKMNIYKSFNFFQHGCASYLNGAWFMYQELNK